MSFAHSRTGAQGICTLNPPQNKTASILVQNLQLEHLLLEGSDIVQQQIVGDAIYGHGQGQLSADDNGENANPNGNDGQGDEEGGADAAHDIGPAALAVHEPPEKVELGLQQGAHLGIEHDLEVALQTICTCQLICIKVVNERMSFED